jgi:small subunit ribosomal protein S25e
MPKGAKEDPKKVKKGVMDKPKNASGAKNKKKKWSKVKTKEKLNNAVHFEPAIYERLVNDICKKSKMITPAIVSDRLKINVSCARRALRELELTGAVKLVGDRHHSLSIYTSPQALVVAADK